MYARSHSMNSSNNLIIPFIPYQPGAGMLAAVGSRLDEFNKQTMPYMLWLPEQEKPIVRFVIGHGHDMVFLKYYVSEKYIAANYHRINETVYKDSCVEFFIGFEHDLNYYNLEFNSAGTVLGQYGCGKANREFLNCEVLELIDTETKIKFNHLDQLFEWELTIAIPTAVFEFHHIDDFAGVTCRLNFFKCGDDLPAPHYLAWNNIHTNKPDFHRPEFFGDGVFERLGKLIEI